MRVLETERLRLRFLRMEDAEAIYSGWAANPRVTNYLTWQPHTALSETKKLLHRWISYYRLPDCWRYGIERLDDSMLIGIIDVVGYRGGSPVIGYVLREDCWGSGYMTEALRAVTAELFASGYRTVIAEAIQENIGSNRVLQKCGFKLMESRTEPLSKEKPDIVTINSYRLRK